MARMLEIMSKADLSEDKQHIFDAIVGSRGKMRLPFSILLNSPEVAGGVAHLGTYLFLNSSLPTIDREIATLTAAREFDCEYEWSAHARSARQAGVPEGVIDAIGHRRPLDSLAKEEALIVAYGREMLRDHQISDATFKAALARYGNLSLVDLTATMGYYVIVACAFNAYGVEALPEWPPLPKSTMQGAPHPKPSTSPDHRSSNVDRRTVPRIPMILSKMDLPNDRQRFFDSIVQSMGAVSGPFALMLHSPEVAARTAQLRRYLFSESSLTAVERYLATLLAVREADCEYVWSKVAVWAIEAGARQEVIDVIGHRRPLDSLTEEEAVIVAYGRALLHDHRVSDATFEAARARYGNLSLTDLTAILGYYTAIACVINAFGLEAPPGLPRLP